MTGLSVAVVGAGPAGTSIARLLALQGAQVSLFEARHLPRAKACGGGLTPKAQRMVRRACSPSWSVGFTRWNSEAAALAGVDVKDGQRVGEVVEDDRGVTLMVHGRRHRADVLVAADGEPSGIARQLGLASPSVRRSFALHLDTSTAPSIAADTAIPYLNVPGGYAWYFPKDGHANVGVVSSRPGTAETIAGVRKPALDRVLHDLGLGAEDGRVTGHWIPQALRRGTLATRRVILVGDAATAAGIGSKQPAHIRVTVGIASRPAVADLAAAN